MSIEPMNLIPKPSRRRLDPAERYTQLLNHAISAFAEAGIERAAHADVACRANVSTPTVFKYFPTREALVDAVLSEVENTLFSLGTELPSDIQLSSFEFVRLFSGALSHLCIQRPDLIKVALMWSVAFSTIRGRYLSFEIKMLNIMSSLLNPETTHKSDTLILFATAKIFARMHFDETTADIRREYINRVHEIFESASAAQQINILCSEAR